MRLRSPPNVDKSAYTSYAEQMPATTTIRIDTDTHAQLVALSRKSGSSLIATVRAAAEALRRQQFGEQVAREIDELQRDPAAWEEYLAEGESTSVADGVA